MDSLSRATIPAALLAVATWAGGASAQTLTHNGFNNSLSTTGGPTSYGYGMGNDGMSTLGNHGAGGMDQGYGLSTITAGYLYGGASLGATSYGYGGWSYTPAPNLGAFAGNVTGTATGYGFAPLYSPAAMSMNGIYATQYGPYGLGRNWTGSLAVPSAAAPPIGGITFIPGPLGMKFLR